MKKVNWEQLKLERERSGKIAANLSRLGVRTRPRDPEEARLLTKSVQERAAKGYPYKFD